MSMPNRKWQGSAAGSYRFSFNGMEKEEEQLEQFTTYYRQLDVRIGRWLSLDPAASIFPNESPYNFVFNTPTISTDINGDCPNGDCNDREVVLADRLVRKTYDPQLSLEDNMQKLGIAIAEYMGTGSKSARKTFSLNTKNQVTQGTGIAYNRFSDLAEGLMADKIIGSKFLTNESKRINEYNAAIEAAPDNETTAKLIYERSIFINAEYEKAQKLFGEVRDFFTGLAMYSLGNTISSGNTGSRSFNIPRSKAMNDYLKIAVNKRINFGKQQRHLAGVKGSEGKSYFNDIKDAQRVLDAIHSGEATFLGVTKAGHLTYKFSGVTGYNVNIGKGITSQPTNIFVLKGSSSPSIVPTSPFFHP